MVDILVISISNPLKIGVYEDGNLLKKYEIDGKTSDILPNIFKKIMDIYEIQRLFYVNSPGSYMAIKVAYVYLKSISIIKQIPLFATSGFNFNQNSPIKALGKKYFINNDDKIVVDFICQKQKIEDFILPKCLDEKIFSKNTLPIYNLPAV